MRIIITVLSSPVLVVVPNVNFAQVLCGSARKNLLCAHTDIGKSNHEIAHKLVLAHTAHDIDTSRSGEHEVVVINRKTIKHIDAVCIGLSLLGSVEFHGHARHSGIVVLRIDALSCNLSARDIHNHINSRLAVLERGCVDWRRALCIAFLLKEYGLLGHRNVFKSVGTVNGSSSLDFGSADGNLNIYNRCAEIVGNNTGNGAFPDFRFRIVLLAGVSQYCPPQECESHGCHG